MAYSQKRRRGRNRDDVQDKKVRRVPKKTGGSVPDDGRVSVEVFNPRIFLLHNAHIQSGKEPPKGCVLCGSMLAAPAVVVEIRVSGKPVDSGGGADEADAASSAPDNELWPWEVPPGSV